MRRFAVRRPSAGLVVASFALVVALTGTNAYATATNFLLNTSNTSTSQTTLNGSAIAGKALQITNTNTGTGATALGLSVASGHPPFTVNSTTRVAHLNASMLGGLLSDQYQKASDNLAIHRVQLSPGQSQTWNLGPLEITGNCTSPSSGLVEFDQNYTNTGANEAQVEVGYIQQSQSSTNVTHSSYITGRDLVSGATADSVSYEVAATGQFDADLKVVNVTWDDSGDAITGTYYAVSYNGICVMQGALNRTP